MAEAYLRLVEIAELQQLGQIPDGKPTSMSEALRRREDAEYDGHMPKPVR